MALRRLAGSAAGLRAGVATVRRAGVVLPCHRAFTSTPMRFDDAPVDYSEKKEFSPKIVELAETISNLSLLEAADLNECLRDKLGLKGVSFAPAAAAAPAGGAAAPAEEAEEAAPEKTAFGIKLVSFDAKKKIPVIREVKALCNNTLAEAKAMVEGVPKVIKSDVPKSEAEELKKKFEEAGAVVELD